MSDSSYTNLKYNKTEMNKRFNSTLKEIHDEIHRTTLINLMKYKIIMFAMDKFMKMETTEQNKVALYLFNNIK